MSEGTVNPFDGSWRPDDKVISWSRGTVNWPTRRLTNCIKVPAPCVDHPFKEEEWSFHCILVSTSLGPRFLFMGPLSSTVSCVFMTGSLCSVTSTTTLTFNLTPSFLVIAVLFFGFLFFYPATRVLNFFDSRYSAVCVSSSSNGNLFCPCF